MRNMIIGMFAGIFLTTAIAAGPAMDQLANWKRDTAIYEAICFSLVEGDIEKLNTYSAVHIKAYENVSGQKHEGFMSVLLTKMGDKSYANLTHKILKEVVRMLSDNNQPTAPSRPRIEA